MARSTTAPAGPPKEPGRIAQMWTVLRMTIREDPPTLWILIASFVLPIAAAVVAGLFLLRDNLIGLVLLIVAGALLGFLLFLVVLGRRAERAAYTRIAGQPGAVSAVIQNSLRGGWTGEEMPVSVNARTQDAIYRVIGPGGVALIAEGPASHTQKLVDEQRRLVARTIPNVAVSVIRVGPDPDSVPLTKLSGALRKLPNQLRKAEIRQIQSRLRSIGANKKMLPIPAGMDPTRVRAPRPR